jgi:MFS transporter, ACS family, L-galactonate transporter
MLLLQRQAHKEVVPSYPRAGQATALGLLFFAGVVNFFDRTALSVANTSVRADFHLSATEIGWLLSAFSLAYGCAQLPLVGLLRRASTRIVLGAGLAVWSAAQVLTGLVRTFPAFLLLRALLGAGESPFYPCGVHVVREWFPQRTRGRATAVMSMSQTLGLAAAPPVLTWLMLRSGWRIMFVELGCAGLLAAAAWMFFYRAAPERQPNQPEHTGAAEDLWRALLRQRMVWGMMLGFGGINYTNWLYTAWLPGYLQAAHGVSLQRTGWMAAIPFLGGAAGMFASGMTTDTLARKGVALATAHRGNLVVGMVCSAASTWIVAQSASATRAVAGISAALFFIHYAGTSGWGYVQTVVRPAWVGSLGALQNFASFLIASAAPVITGWLLDRTHSFTLALNLCTAVTLLGALSYATLAAPRRRAPLHTEGEPG